MSYRMSSRRRLGFTLIELLVVIAIIAILAAILFPVFAQAREKARSASCQSNLKQMMTAVKMYTQDYDEYSLQYTWGGNNGRGSYPAWPELLQPYVKNLQVFQCPSAPRDTSSYTTGCAGTTIVATYCFPSWIRYSYYRNPSGSGSPLFLGFPVGIEPISKKDACTAPWELCIPSTEFVGASAESAYLVEGYVANYYPTPGTQLGSSCTTGLSFNPANTAVFRHNGGMNVGYCDGHVKHMRAKDFWGNSSAVHQYSGQNYPASPYMKVGGN